MLSPNENPATGGTITDVPGIRVGHFTDKRRPTGCTAILFDNEASVGADYDGSAPGSSLGVMLQPVSPVNTIHAMLLTGGGALGLPAVGGVTRYLQERKVGFDWGVPEYPIPIVVGAVIADNEVGDPRVIPDADAAYQACQNASTRPVEEGNVGVGAGATIGKMLKEYKGMKGGLGSASLRLGEVVLGALVVINAVGDIVDWRTGKIVAGARRPDGKGFVNIVETLKKLPVNKLQSSRWLNDPALRSTTLVVVATNADFNKTAMTKIAMMASVGAGRTISPYHTTGDGDSTFGLSTNKVKSALGISVIGALAAELVSEAVVRAAKAAKSVEGWVACSDYNAG
jgi:L-aminopeptidase/D-esterase-like protein